MKRKTLLLLSGIAFFTILGLTGFKTHPAQDPWKPSQLLAPADLANTINDPKAQQPIIFSIGPGALVKGSIDMGPARDSVNLNKFKLQLSKLPKDALIVIYCGCCPFEHCPNIRPAFTLLNDMKFTRHKLLNIEHNIKTDWINKGYPVTP
ncbi:MAG TPA: rhodanese-like domain-containing protein [Puia sp.]